MILRRQSKKLSNALVISILSTTSHSRYGAVVTLLATNIAAKGVTEISGPHGPLVDNQSRMWLYSTKKQSTYARLGPVEGVVDTFRSSSYSLFTAFGISLQSIEYFEVTIKSVSSCRYAIVQRLTVIVRSKCLCCCGRILIKNADQPALCRWISLLPDGDHR